MPHICPAWIGYLLLNPLRRLLENPERMFEGLVREGMTLLEPGCGMGYFTLPLARLVGSSGKIVAVDIQPRMLSGLKRRALKAGLSDRIDIRQSGDKSLGIADLAGKVDLALAIHMVHELEDQESFFRETWSVLKPDGMLLVLEPPLHVSRKALEKSISLARRVGFEVAGRMGGLTTRGVMLRKGVRMKAPVQQGGLPPGRPV